MSTKILTRKAIDADILDKVLDEGIKDLAERTKQAFGYRSLSDHVSGKGNSVQLRKAMVELNIQPYDGPAAKAFEKEQVGHDHLAVRGSYKET